MAAPARTILHVDLDAFFAAVEQRDDPSLRGKPVIVGGSARRGVVAACSYEARRFGVKSAMPMAVALRLCPKAVVVRHHMERYAEASRAFFTILGDFAPVAEALSFDEAFLDVTGSRALFGDGPSIAARLKREVLAATQLTVSVGVATSKYVAKVASDLRKPDGLVAVAPGDERAFLAPLPLSRLWGVGPVTQQQLERAGLRTIGDVQARSEHALVAAFGDNLGQHLFVLANGLDPRAVEPERAAKSIGHELTFADDLHGEDEVTGILLQLAEMVGRRLRRHGQRATVVRLKLRYGDFTTLVRQRKVAPTADDLELYGVARELLFANWDRGRGVRLLGISGALLVGGAGPAQQSLFAAVPRKRDRLLQAMDAVRDRHGEDSLRHGGERRRSNPWGPDRE